MQAYSHAGWFWVVQVFVNGLDLDMKDAGVIKKMLTSVVEEKGLGGLIRAGR